MKNPFRLFVMLAAAVAALAVSAPAQAAEGSDEAGAAFVQTNDPAGNSIDAYRRNGDGSLTFDASYATGGLGGRENGAGSDPLATQGSLRLVAGGRLLVAVNAGSNTISVFAVHGARLDLVQVLPSGGPFPTATGTRGDLLYVLDAGGAGFVSGFRIDGARLHAIAGSTRTLGLANTTPPFFLNSPAQVGFTPDGEHLIVTTKLNGTVDVFAVGRDGLLSAAPVKNPVASPVPFAWVFDRDGRMVLNFAGTSSLQTFTVNEDGTITPVSASVSDTQAALCWVTPAAGYLYTSNTGSNDVSQYNVVDGTPVLVRAVAATGIKGATDSAAAGRYLYVQSGLSGTVSVYAIGEGGALALVQVANVPDGGSQEGIAVS